MITLTLWQLLVMGALNVGVLAFLVVDWFRRTYTIVDIDTWNKLATFYNEHSEDEDENNELAGGTGFFREALYEEIDDEEEIEDDE